MVRSKKRHQEPRGEGITSIKGMTHDEARAAGKALRSRCPRDDHRHWKPSRHRADAVDLLLAAEQGRLPDLLPLRHGRMARSPFTFYRGAALTMATDLASNAVSGIRVQACGDAHLSNFGGFGTPERRVIFAINDLDETLPAPWEWDVKRLAASFVVASRNNGLRDGVAKEIATTCVRTYRESIAEFSTLKTLELWYTALLADDLVAAIKDPDLRKRALARLRKERARSIAEDIFPQLVEHKGERPQIKDQLPTIFHAEGMPPGKILKVVMDAFAGYRASLHASYQSLLDRFEIYDFAIKVVGVGSVGTRCWVILLMASDDDPLFLQVKEARASVLEPFAGPSPFTNHGRRVVNGYRLMQPASDIFLGWTAGPKADYFVRQLRDIKISIDVEALNASAMDLYATWCGRALAISHARSGNSAMLSGYMGRSDVFDASVAEFALAYADQNEKDHAVLQRAIQSGRITAQFEEDK